MNSLDWVKFLSEKIFFADLEEETVYSLLHYLEDLELLVPSENVEFVWKDLPEGLSLEEMAQFIQTGLKKMSSTKLGFALPFFIKFEHIELSTIQAIVESGKNAYTSYKKIDQNKKFSMLRVNILTGRTHQIRVHLSSIGCPVIGDNLYSNNKNNTSRLYLHSIRIKFNHPANNKEIEIHDNIPKEFIEILK